MQNHSKYKQWQDTRQVNPSSWSPIILIVLSLKAKYRLEHNRTKHKCKSDEEYRINIQNKYIYILCRINAF